MPVINAARRIADDMRNDLDAITNLADFLKEKFPLMQSPRLICIIAHRLRRRLGELEKAAQERGASA